MVGVQLQAAHINNTRTATLHAEAQHGTAQRLMRETTYRGTLLSLSRQPHCSLCLLFSLKHPHSKPTRQTARTHTTRKTHPPPGCVRVHQLLIVLQLTAHRARLTAAPGTPLLDAQLTHPVPHSRVRNKQQRPTVKPRLASIVGGLNKHTHPPHTHLVHHSCSGTAALTFAGSSV